METGAPNQFLQPVSPGVFEFTDVSQLHEPLAVIPGAEEVPAGQWTPAEDGMSTPMYVSQPAWNPNEHQVTGIRREGKDVSCTISPYAGKNRTRRLGK